MTEKTLAERIDELSQPVTLLKGHISEETAYVVDDYPFGFRLRCKIRYWVETAAKGQQRVVSQTTNPKRPGEVWNKPKPGIYATMAFLYLAPNGHVQWAYISKYGANPSDDAFIRLSGIYDQMDDSDRRFYDALVKICRSRDSYWGRFEDTVNALSAHYADTGELLPRGDRGSVVANGPYVSEREYEVAAAWVLSRARQEAA
ncbi:hypothetical protein [Microbispora sp. NPDC049125]|uniref:hypothetical protein n=1 Tax=Microbispora sp. NPDC049125 TaxID=3154929 RepID=UPI0034674F6F